MAKDSKDNAVKAVEPIGADRGMRVPTDEDILNQCNQALAHVLDGYGCALQAKAEISPEGRIVTSVQLVRIKR